MENQLKEQIRDVLADGLGYMKAISKNYTILTNAISNGDQSNISKNYEDLREGLKWIEDALKNFEILLELDYSAILIGKQSSKKIMDNYKSFILELEDAYNRCDYNKLAELTDKQISKHLKKIISIFIKVKKDMNKKEN